MKIVERGNTTLNNPSERKQYSLEVDGTTLDGIGDLTTFGIERFSAIGYGYENDTLTVGADSIRLQMQSPAVNTNMIARLKNDILLSWQEYTLSCRIAYVIESSSVQGDIDCVVSVNNASYNNIALVINGSSVGIAIKSSTIIAATEVTLLGTSNYVDFTATVNRTTEELTYSITADTGETGSGTIDISSDLDYSYSGQLSHGMIELEGRYVDDLNVTSFSLTGPTNVTSKQYDVTETSKYTIDDLTFIQSTEATAYGFDDSVILQDTNSVTISNQGTAILAGGGVQASGISLSGDLLLMKYTMQVSSTTWNASYNPKFISFCHLDDTLGVTKNWMVSGTENQNTMGTFIPWTFFYMGSFPIFNTSYDTDLEVYASSNTLHTVYCETLMNYRDFTISYRVKDDSGHEMVFMQDLNTIKNGTVTKPAIPTDFTFYLFHKAHEVILTDLVISSYTIVSESTGNITVELDNSNTVITTDSLTSGDYFIETDDSGFTLTDTSVVSISAANGYYITADKRWSMGPYETTFDIVSVDN